MVPKFRAATACLSGSPPDFTRNSSKQNNLFCMSQKSLSKLYDSIRKSKFRSLCLQWYTTRLVSTAQVLGKIHAWNWYIPGRSFVMCPSTLQPFIFLSEVRYTTPSPVAGRITGAASERSRKHSHCSHLLLTQFEVQTILSCNSSRHSLQRRTCRLLAYCIRTNIQGSLPTNTVFLSSSQIPP
jgi:hypothetical protein